MPSSHLPTAPCQWFFRLAAALDCRSAARLARLFLGAVLARGRRTVTSWIRAAELSDEFRSCYTTVAAAGKRADAIAGRLAYAAVKPLVGDADRLRRPDVGHLDQRARSRIALAEEQEVVGQLARQHGEVGLHVTGAEPGRDARERAAPDIGPDLPRVPRVDGHGGILPES